MSESNRSILDIVNEILQSPQLRSAVENCVRGAPPTPPNLSQSNTLECPGQQNINAELHRLFPTIRPRHVLSSNFQNNVRRPNNNRRSTQQNPAIPKFFSKDVILVLDPKHFKTYTGKIKASAFEQGLAISEAKFQCEWNFQEIKNYINSLFEKWLKDTDFEILIPIGGRLVKPQLLPGEELNGLKIKRLFHQKVIYIRCNQTINLGEEVSFPDLFSNTETNQDEETFETNNNEVDVKFEEETVAAIEISLLEENNTQHKCIEDILEFWRKKINDKNVTQVNVYREDIFNCFNRTVSRKCFDVYHAISVKFSDLEGTSEGAVDLGGPTREMFRLLMSDLCNSVIFHGTKWKNLTLDQRAIKKSLYFQGGRLIAISMIHGGPFPKFFSTTLYNSVVFDIHNIIPKLEDVEETIKCKILPLYGLVDCDEIQNYIDSNKIFNFAGIEIIESVDQRDNIIESILKFFVLYRTRPALDQFINGLKVGGVHETMCKFPDLFKSVFCCGKTPIAANLLETLFTVNYSPNGSNKRQVENRIITFWRDYLLDCESEGEGVNVSLENILIFATGADEVPPLGFPPSISFLHGHASTFPKANTCNLELQLPVVSTTYEDFKLHLNFAIANTNDFGFA